MTSWAPDRIDIEAYSANSELWHKSCSNGTWTEWENLGGTLIYHPASVSLSSKKVHCFGIGPNSELYHKWLNPAGQWVDWASLQGTCMTAPVAVKYDENKIAVFVIGFDRAAYVCMGSDDTTFTWKSLGGFCPGDSLAACSWENGRIDLVGIGKDSAMQHLWYCYGKWQATPANLGGVCIDKPTIVACKPNRLDVFVKGANSAMHHTHWNGSAWIPFRSLGGVHIYNPEAVTWGPGRIDVFSVSPDTKLTHIYADIAGTEPGTFNGNWEKLGGTVTTQPKVVCKADRNIDVFTRGYKSNVQIKSYDTTSGWRPPTYFQDLEGIVTCKVT